MWLWPKGSGRRLLGSCLLALLLLVGMLPSVQAETVTAPIALKATDFSDGAGKLKVTNEGGGVRISNAQAYQEQFIPISTAQVTADLDKVPYFYYDMTAAQVPYSISLALPGQEQGVFVAANQYVGTAAPTHGGFAAGELLGVSGVQTVEVRIHWMTWGTEYPATEAGQHSLVLDSIGFTDEAGVQALDSKYVISGGTALELEGFQWNPSRVTVTAEGDGFSMTVPGNAEAPFAEMTQLVRVNLDKVPYLYVDVEDAQTSWKVKLGVGEDLFSADPTNAADNLSPGARGLYRFNMAAATGLSGAQDIVVYLYIVDSDFEATAGSVNRINGLYIDGEEFTFGDRVKHPVIAEPTLLDPADFRYTKSMLDFQAEDNGFTAQIPPGTVPSWQTMSMGLTIDFDKISTVCANIPDATGEFKFFIHDYETNTDYPISATFKKGYSGLLTMDMSGVEITGVKSVQLCCTYTDGTFKNKLTVDNLYLTTADGAAPEGIVNLPAPTTPGESSAAPAESSAGQTTSRTEAGSAPGGDDKGSGSLTIVLIVIGCVVVLAGAGAAVWIVMRRKKQKEAEGKEESEEEKQQEESASNQ